MLADMASFRRRVGERNRPVESGTRFLGAAQLHEKGASRPKIVEIGGKALLERFDHLQRRLGAIQLGGRYRAVESHHGRRLYPFQSRIERVDLRPVSVLMAGCA